MPDFDPNDFDAVTFDVYGTILDWEPDIGAFLTDWAAEGGAPRGAAELIAAYDRARIPIQEIRPALPYPEVLRRTLDALGAKLGLPVPEERRAAFGGTAARHRPFPDSVPALETLRAHGLKLAALSNIDEASFAAAMEAAGIRFDVVVTAERVGAYKPDPAHFHAALADLEAMEIGRGRVLHAAQSLRADIAPAGDLGLATVWVNRRNRLMGRIGAAAAEARPDWEAASLTDLAAMFHGR